jgi:hypothetical protein
MLFSAKLLHTKVLPYHSTIGVGSISYKIAFVNRPNLTFPLHWTDREIDCDKPAAYDAIRKEASGLRLLTRVLYTLEVRGSNPLPPTT